MIMSGNVEENKRIIMDLNVVLKCNDCSNIVKCLGYFISNGDVWYGRSMCQQTQIIYLTVFLFLHFGRRICMDLMAICFDKLLKKIKTGIPECILGKLTVSVSTHTVAFAVQNTCLCLTCLFFSHLRH